MAHKDSEELKTNERYPLGEYSFRIERTSVPGSTNDKIEAICTDKDGKNARKSIQVPSTAQIDGWYVEANETEASVYIVVSKSGEINAILSVADGDWLGRQSAPTGYRCSATPQIGLSSQGASVYLTQYNGGVYSAKSTANTIGSSLDTTGHSSAGAWSAANKSDTFKYLNSSQSSGIGIPTSTINPNGKSIDYIGFNGEKLVARFAIDIEDAGGVGPGSDWYDPGDYDPGWEPGEPTHTLHVEVAGALSGRHNDPLNDPSYSYIPADKDTEKDYGCGGDGGHGGGGGAGASSVIVHKFATNRANDKEITAIAKRHGYGSGGGKGGKGGSGCILVYY